MICPCDDLVPFALTTREELQRYDYFWATRTTRDLPNEDETLMDGEHLYPLATVEYMLEMELIEPAQITHALRASRHLEPVEWRRVRAIIKEACVKSDN